MKYEQIVLTVALVVTVMVSITGLVAVTTANAQHLEPKIPLEEQPCKFTAHIDKTIRKFTERIQVFGFVHPNCETQNLWESYRVNVKIVDMDGNVIEDNWLSKARLKVEKEQRPSLYEFDAIIQETGVRLQQDENTGRHYKVYPYQYYTSVPQLNSVHFDAMVVYSVQVTYGNMTVSNNFLILEEE